MTTKAFSYLRFSTPEQMKGDSTRRQASLAVEYALRKGLELDDKLTFHDLGVSAYRGKNAETGALGVFLEAVRAGLVPKGSFLLVESLDRISRQAARKAIKVLDQIVEEDITVVTLVDGREINTKTLDEDPTALIMAILVFMRSNEESAMKSRRLRSAWSGKRDELHGEKVTLTRNTPAWIHCDEQTRKFTLIRERAGVIRRIFSDYLKGFGPTVIARTLNEQGIPLFIDRPNGRDTTQWHTSYIRRLLVNPAVIGEFTPNVHEHHDGKKRLVPQKDRTVKDYFPRVISDEVWDQVRGLNQKGASPRRGKSPTHGVQNLFAGLSKCGRCGGTMTQINKPTNGVQYRYLVCNKARTKGGNCKYTAVRYPSVEARFLEEVPVLLIDLPAGPGMSAADAEELRWKRASREANGEKLQNIQAAVEAGGGVAPATLMGRIREIETENAQFDVRVADLQAQADASSGPLVQTRAAGLLAALRGEPLDRAVVNSQLRLVFSEIRVDPDEGVLELHWRHGAKPSEIIYSMPVVK